MIVTDYSVRLTEISFGPGETDLRGLHVTGEARMRNLIE